MDLAFDGVAASKLLLWGDAPPSHRARRLWDFMGLHLRRGHEAIHAPRGFDLEHTGTLRSLLETLAARHGVLVARELPAAVERPVSIALENTTLLGALDEGCAQAGCHGGQRARGELIVHDGPEPRYPAAYIGPLRVRMVELASTRSTDFTTTTTSSRARLRIEWEWPVGPVGPLSLAMFGDPRIHQATSVTNVHHIGMVAEPWIDLPAGGSSLALAGTVTAMFEGAYDELALAVGTTAELHGLQVTALPIEHGCHLQIETVDPARLVASADGGAVDFGLSPLILASATTGEESIPQIHRMRVASHAPGSERWGLKFRDGFGQVSELRLRVAASPSRASFSWALPPQALP